jgi:hypothetical protein
MKKNYVVRVKVCDEFPNRNATRREIRPMN